MMADEIDTKVSKSQKIGLNFHLVKINAGLSTVASVLRAAVVLALVVSLATSNLVLQIVSIYSVAFVVGLTSDILKSTRESWTKQFLMEGHYKNGSALMQNATSLGQAV